MARSPLLNSTVARQHRPRATRGCQPDGGALYTALQQGGTATLNVTNTILANSTGSIHDAVNNGGNVAGSTNLLRTSAASRPSAGRSPPIRSST